MRQVISASRRTDIPAWYLDRLIGFIECGYVETPNPYSGKAVRVDLRPGSVHTLVLWSKNFGPFLKKTGFFKDYNLYFLFTVNDMPGLESAAPPLAERFRQVRELAALYGPDRIGWRYDPVIFDENGPVSAIESYTRIGSVMVEAGVRRSIFSFLDMYGKVVDRNRRFDLKLVDPPEEVKAQYARELVRAAESLGLTLESCSETVTMADGIKSSACIDGRLLSRLAGEPASLSKDQGQRPACNCTVSRDIGSYREMPCPGGCLYCYANPVVPVPEREEA
ncbi:DUF1848 domain-containing protein [bacterium]|nr:DUF1848 domain-containing protein [bacterium]